MSTNRSEEKNQENGTNVDSSASAVIVDCGAKMLWIIQNSLRFCLPFFRSPYSVERLLCKHFPLHTQVTFKSVEFPLRTRILSNLFVSSFIDRRPKANTTIPRRKRVINIWEYYRTSDKFSSRGVENEASFWSLYLAMQNIRRSKFLISF